MIELKLTQEEAKALHLLAMNSADDGLDEFFDGSPELEAPAASALEKLREARHA